MFNNDLKRIVVRGCDENDKDALRWCVAKPDKRKSRKMSCKPFATLVYQKMGWDSECRYKMLGYRITFEGETLYVFDSFMEESPPAPSTSPSTARSCAAWRRTPCWTNAPCGRST